MGLEVNENVLIEATKYSTVSQCIKKTVGNLFKTGDDEPTVRRKPK